MNRGTFLKGRVERIPSWDIFNIMGFVAQLCKCRSFRYYMHAYSSQHHVSFSSVDTDMGFMNNIIFQGCMHEVNMFQCAAAFVAMVMSLM